MNKYQKGFTPIVIALIVLVLAVTGGTSYYLINNFTKKTAEEVEQSYIKLISPNGGEQWEINKTYNITWKSQNVEKVSIYLSQENGSDVIKTIATDLPASLNGYYWTVPSDSNDINTGGQFLITISADGNNNLYDKSDNSFNIAPLVSNNDKEPVNTITGNTVKIDIVNGAKRCEFEASGKLITYYQEILKAIYPDKTEKILYSTDSSPVLSEDCYSAGGIGGLILSPNEKYLIFYKTGWEIFSPYMLNIETGKYVFGNETEINDMIPGVRDIKWSSDNNNFAITTDSQPMVGLDDIGVYASFYNNPNKIKKVWSINDYLGEINKVMFVGNDKLRIETEQRDKEGSPQKSITYEYDYKQDRLVIVNN